MKFDGKPREEPVAHASRNGQLLSVRIGHCAVALGRSLNEVPNATVIEREGYSRECTRVPRGDAGERFLGSRDNKFLKTHLGRRALKGRDRTVGA